MITSNAVGVYSDDGKHTAPPGHDNNNTCRPVSRHNRLTASRAASVTTRRPPRTSTRSEESSERSTVSSASSSDTLTTTPPEEPPAPEQPPHLIAREHRSPPTAAAGPTARLVGLRAVEGDGSVVRSIARPERGDGRLDLVDGRVLLGYVLAGAIIPIYVTSLATSVSFDA
jgi:hypothetical protein